MPDYRSRCPGCASAIPARAIAFQLQLECGACRTPLRVPRVYQMNVMIASFVQGLGAAYLLGAERHFAVVTFASAFVFAMFLLTTVMPLVPPRLERR